MKYQTKRLSICIALVLLCAFVLPLFGGCAKDGKESGKNEVVNKVTEENKTEEKKPGQTVPAVTESDPNAPSLQSTPNKGGSYQITSGTQPVKSAYVIYLEEQAKITEAMLQADKEKAMQARRDLAEKTFRTMLTIPWTPQDTFSYTVDSATYEMVKDTVYYGLPYAHGAQSLVAHMLFQTAVKENGVSVMNFSEPFIGGSSTTSRLGCNREDALIQAWHTVSDSSFAGTPNDMIPSNGYLFVGDLKIPRATVAVAPPDPNDPALQFGGGSSAQTQYGDGGASVLADGSLAGDTPKICKETGEQGMYKAYAQLQKADGLVKNGSGTDAMMVVSVSVVKNPDGTIDGEKSEITYLKQHHVFDKDKKTFAKVDEKITFKKLFSDTFIPITVKELIDGSPVSEVTLVRDSLGNRQKQVNLYAGVLTCNRRIAYMTHIVVDSNGTTVSKGIHLATQSDLRFSATEKRFAFNIQKITEKDSKEPGRYLFDAAVGSQLAHKVDYTKGETYRNIVTLMTVTGETIVARDYTFVAA